jgi:hypothetical protein
MGNLLCVSALDKQHQWQEPLLSEPASTKQEQPEVKIALSSIKYSINGIEKKSVQGHSEEVNLGKLWECLGMPPNLPK